MKRKRLYAGIICGIGCYGATLLALMLAERNDPNASIRTFADALWYSVVTLSTVGYGDLYPVTPAGKLIGLLFVLLSLGAMAFLVGSVVSLFTGRLLPKLRIFFLRDRQWYVFSQANDASIMLARSLRDREPDAVLLFPEEDREKIPPAISRALYPETIASAVAKKKDRCKIIFLEEASGTNYSLALNALSLGHGVYCRTEQTPDQCPETLHLFNRYDCCARDYWRARGLRSEENTVVLIGDGRYARQLLEQGLTVNVFGPERTVTYHLFGDWGDFRREHPGLALTVSMDEKRDGMDGILFHAEPWNADLDLLCRADRIVLCSDADGENTAVLQALRRYVPVSGAVHLRSTVEIPGEICFGTDEQIYSADNVLASGLTATARAMHRIYSAGAADAQDWSQLSEFTRRSNIAAADHLLVKLRLLLQREDLQELTPRLCTEGYARYCRLRDPEPCRQIEHRRWMRFHSLYNWRYGPKRDNAARIHPMMLPYGQLSEEERAKDDYAWQLLGEIAKEEIMGGTV